jgi:hypothetical protein
VVAATSAAFSQQDLDRLLAPVALYPDALLAQVLMASTYPLEVVAAARWRRANTALSGASLESALLKQSWDPSVKALAAVPQVLTMMDDQLEWTQRLGDAFLAQQQDVMATVQSLRLKAIAAGSLKTTSQQQISVDSAPTGAIVTIAATKPQVVYVPVYDPMVVYGSWWWAGYPPYYYYPPAYRPAPGLTFAAGVAVGAALWGQPNWRMARIDVDIDHYYQFNRTRIDGGGWQHNPAHRGPVPYANQQLAERYAAPSQRAGEPVGGARAAPAVAAEPETRGASTRQSRSAPGAGRASAGRGNSAPELDGPGSRR